MARCDFRLIVGLVAVMSMAACNESKDKAADNPAQKGEICGVNKACAEGLECSKDYVCVEKSTVTPGTVGLGENCDSAHRCSEGLLCGNEGKCINAGGTEIVGEGATCDNTHICDNGLTCNSAHVCEKIQSSVTVGEGEQCDLTHVCAKGLLCNNSNICEKPSTVVTVGENESCDNVSTVCKMGLFCNASSKCEKPSSIVTVGEGETCDVGHVCGEDLRCVGGKCQSLTLVDIGGTCDSESHFCKNGLYCNIDAQCIKPISQVIVGENESCDGATRICDTSKDLACLSHVCVVPTEEIKIDCKNGLQVDKSCVCSAGYVVDNDGICTLCAENYELKEGKCTLIVVEPEVCDAVFYYTNEWTHTQSGGASNFDVYLVGSFNEWKAADDDYKMTYLGNGTHGIRLKVNKGDKLAYKFYVNGWADDSWKSDPTNGNYDEDGNNVADINACGLTFGNANSMSIDHPYVEGQDPVVVDPGPVVVDPDPSCTTTFTFINKFTSIASGGEQDWDVYLIGDMNEWKAADPNYKMTSDGNGKHTISLALPQGTSFKYKFYINGWGENSYHADVNKCVDGDCNNQANITTCGQSYVLDETSGVVDPGPVVVDGKISLVSTSVSDKNITIKVALAEGASITEVVGGSGSASFNGDTITDTVTENNKYVYIVKTADSELYVPVWVEDVKFDWHDALLYFAFTDRFVNGDPSNDGKSGTSHSESDWYGGDFKGLKSKVDDDYFTKLGVNTLWISSVSMNTQDVSWGTGADRMHSYSAYHSYWPVATFMYEDTMSDFNGATTMGKAITAIEPHFGTLEDLKDLVDACHKKGMRVLVDFAANHVHKHSPMVAKHPDWINDSGSPRLCDDNGNWDNYSEKCWFSGDLPDINYENPAAREAMVKHAIWLIKQTNIDGFRVDAVKHMNIQFVKDLRYAVDQLFKNTGIMFYMVGETFTGDVGLLNKYIGDDLLHAQFDFPLYYKVQNVVRGNGFYDLSHNYNAHFNSDLMGTFMGNHDVARALSVAAKQNEGKWGHNEDVSDWVPYFNVKAAWTILLTRPGVPLIYYGDEAGMVGSNDPDNRRMMIFDNDLNEQQKSMLDYVQRLGQIRKAHPALRYGTRQDLQADNENWCYLMTSGSDKILVAIATTNGSGCNLGASYKLKPLLSDDAVETTSYINLSDKRLNVYEVLP